MGITTGWQVRSGKMSPCYTHDACLGGLSRKRQSAIDIVRLVRAMTDRLEELTELTNAEEIDIANCLNEFVAVMPKSDREEVRHG